MDLLVTYSEVCKLLYRLFTVRLAEFLELEGCLVTFYVLGSLCCEICEERIDLFN